MVCPSTLTDGYDARQSDTDESDATRNDYR